MSDKELVALRELVAAGYCKPNEDQKEILRLADQRDDLLDALESIERAIAANEPFTRAEHEAARAAIAKARGKS